MPKSAKKTQTIPFVTPWFVARYPKVSKPDTQGKYADGKYKTDGVLDDDDYKGVEKTLKEAAKKLWPDVPVDEVSLPMKTFYKSKEDKAKGEDDGRGIVLKSQYKPAVFDSKKKKLPDGVMIGGGTEMRVASAIFPWSKSEKIKVKDPKTGKVTIEEGTEYGLGLRLGDIQIRKLVEFAGSGDGAAFDEEEGGFEFEGNDEAGGEQFDDSADGL